MTFVVGEDCINCKHTDCVEVCPVDCFYEGPIFWLSTPMNVLIVLCANRSAPWMPSSPRTSCQRTRRYFWS